MLQPLGGTLVGSCPPHRVIVLTDALVDTELRTGHRALIIMGRPVTPAARGHHTCQCACGHKIVHRTSCTGSPCLPSCTCCDAQ
eukprot:scaffold111859_cov21-Tisochrysis_lutea.AAC.2